MNHAHPEVLTHPAQESRDLHPIDRMLRDSGFQVWSRPVVGEPVWRRWEPSTRRWLYYRESDAWELRKAELFGKVQGGCKK